MASIVGTTVIDTGWHHYAYVKDGNDQKVYLDGVLELSGTQNLDSIGPSAIVAYIDNGPAGVPPYPKITCTKIWEAALSQAEVAAEMADYPAVRTTNLYQSAPLAADTDLADTSGNENDWYVDINEPGDGFTTETDGPNGSMPTSISIVGPDGGAFSITENLPVNFGRQFTFMGWWRTEDDTDETSLVRIANDDNVGGTAEVSINITSGAARVLFMDLENGIVTSPVVTITATPEQPVAPIPSTVNLAAFITGGSGFAVDTYLWELVSGPDTPTIATPTADNTDITFTTYTPGAYTFKVTVTGTNVFDSSVTPDQSAIIVLSLPQAVAPTVESGNQQVTYPASATLAPDITDDDWNGSLTYLWTQESGPGAATINSPAAASTTVDFPDTAGAYLFKLTVSNSGHDGVGFWRVTVFNSDPIDLPEDVADTLVTVNGVDFDPLRDSTQITETNGSTPNTAVFKTFRVPIPEGARVIVTHGSAGRLFAGRAMRTNQTTFETEENQLFDAQLNGPEWEMGRRYVTRSWFNTSISTIAANLVALVPGFTATGVQSGLPVLEEFIVQKVSVAVALDRLVSLLPNGHWKADYFNDVTVTTIEDTSEDPIPIDERHPDLRSFSYKKDVSRVVNRLIVTGQNPAVTTEEQNGTFVTELEVDSLENYNSGGGLAELNGQEFTYTGTETRLVGALSSSIALFWFTPTYDISGQLIPGEGYWYTITNVTPDGESTWVSGNGGIFLDAVGQGQNAFDVNILAAGAVPARLLAFNVYRYSNPAGGGDGLMHFVNSTGPGGGIIHDTMSDVELAARQVVPDLDTSGVVRYYLTGITGLKRSVKTADGVKYRFVVDNVASQTAMATLFGGGDDGVVEAPLDVGIVTPDQARIIANAYLQQRNEADAIVEYLTRDWRARPGKTLTVNLTDGRNVQGDFKIQQTLIRNFESGLSPWYSVTATKKIPLVRFESLLRGLVFIPTVR